MYGSTPEADAVALYEASAMRAELAARGLAAPRLEDLVDLPPAPVLMAGHRGAELQAQAVERLEASPGGRPSSTLLDYTAAARLERLADDEAAHRRGRQLPPDLAVPCPSCLAAVGDPCRTVRRPLVETPPASHPGRGA